MNTGVACECTNCGSTQWYDSGICQGCHSDAGIQFTWVVAKAARGGGPKPAPAHLLQLQQGVSAQLVNIWTNLILVRGLTPVQPASREAVSHYVSPGWYRQRGVECSVRFFGRSGDHNSAEQLNRAADWANQSFVVRLVVTFESFAMGPKHDKARLPKNPGMREFHHARQLRNAIGHGNPLTDQKDVMEEEALFRSGTHGRTNCNLAINEVLEPLWARLLLFARSLEEGAAPLPPNPAVVVAVSGKTLVVQSLTRSYEMPLTDGDPRLNHKIGDVIGV